MSPDEFKAWRQSMGYTQAKAIRRFYWALRHDHAHRRLVAKVRAIQAGLALRDRLRREACAWWFA